MHQIPVQQLGPKSSGVVLANFREAEHLLGLRGISQEGVAVLVPGYHDHPLQVSHQVVKIPMISHDVPSHFRTVDRQHSHAAAWCEAGLT